MKFAKIVFLIDEMEWNYGMNTFRFYQIQTVGYLQSLVHIHVTFYIITA
jgi:hypothetical protein